MKGLYYTPPKDEYFEEVKREAIKLWETYDNEFGYVDEKVNRIKDIKNIEDNFMYIVAMFDIFNQAKLAVHLSKEACKEIHDRMVDGGNEEEYIRF